MAKNERNTENLVRDALRKFEYYDDGNDIQVEEQKSHIDAVKRLLKAASKSGGGGIGSPEFIVSSPSHPDFLIIIECKASTKDHCSAAFAAVVAGSPVLETGPERTKRLQRFATDGVAHYAQHLAREFNVIAIAASGETKGSLKISTFLFGKGQSAPRPLHTPSGNNIDEIIPWHDYISHAEFDPAIQKVRFDELMAFSRELHDFMRDHAKLTESEKPLMVSGTLIALRNKAFAKAFDEYAPEDLQKQWMQVIQDEIQKADIPKAKKANMAQPYSSIAVHPELSKKTKNWPRGVLHELIRRLREKVWPFISVYHEYDVVGQFYGEFLKYTGGDKKALGIVLTPRHVTELFALLANVNKESRVLDICAGTGGFLISAMREMIKDASTEGEIFNIKSSGLIGVEQQPNMFALAASNMILRGDGKANLHQGSCFDDAISSAIKTHKCTVGLLNPPFSQGDADLHELYFVKQMLDCLNKHGVGVAIVPISCAISPHPAKTELLKAHTLEAVMSMPLELFSPVGTVTCVMVFTAGVPHASSKRKTWFGYWRDDGFVKTKHLGRIDQDGKWPTIRERWVSSYRNREVHAGESVMVQVGASDEWCAEAYLETDYSGVSQSDFEEEVKKYLVFHVMNQNGSASAADGEEADAND
ncbi:class I SAM-dependent DNA methyltransferase [Novosphingobium sp. JCM 18896]|uniref:HsdM family class I SAM-dependent methyltransferase n=1 Tax=Novosphingobium sp. JCM 18896 TaxID=2989731 RepID=UPI00222274A0|nr:N-6 DNA methylase [Novosphingobium sp. JCM 18896]